MSKEKTLKMPDASPPPPGTAGRALQHQNIPAKPDASPEQAAQQQQ